MLPATDRRGFALLAVLWIIVALTVIALVMNLCGRQALGTAQRRLDLARARWQAEDCLERLRAAANDVVSGRAVEATGYLDQSLLSSSYLSGTSCDLTIRPGGTALDINLADNGQWRRFFGAVGVPEGMADSLTAAILDWRDVDDIPRPLGAERDWYLANHQHLPRNAPFADERELHRVRGFATVAALVPGMDTLLAVGSGPVVPRLAPLSVIASLPNVNAAFLDRIHVWRELAGEDNNRRISSLTDSLIRNGALSGIAVHDPNVWVVTARGTSGAGRAASETIEITLARAGNRVGIIRRRSWP